MHVPPPPSGATLMDSIWESIITPGASPTLIATINGTLALLLCAVSAPQRSGVAATVSSAPAGAQPQPAPQLPTGRDVKRDVPLTLARFSSAPG